MKDWEWIRRERDDLTDYVIHFTKNYVKGPICQLARNSLAQILVCGYIRPTFAARPSRHASVPHPTIKGPFPAVCLTGQPIRAVLKMARRRYSGFGIAYHKVALYNAGGRPVMYGSERELGRPLRRGEPGWQEGKEVYTDGLPADLQYLWARYIPMMPGSNDDPVDFTWEREWRVKTESDGLPVLLPTDRGRPPTGIIVVERDDDVQYFRGGLAKLAAGGKDWAKQLNRIVSLETAERRLNDGDLRYAKLETWPDESESVNRFR